ncbi:MAG TPA: NADH-quinone oxidoreductase subunit A [Gammaproteobacteria bacterium]
MPDEALWPLGLYLAAVLVLVALVLGASHVLGERHRERATGDPFESGMVPVHRARFRVDAQFYVLAVLFVIFDLEAIFVITWAVIAREGGWPAYIEIAIFIVVLIAALAYLWRVGALDWGPHGRRPASRSRLFPTAARLGPTLTPAGRESLARFRGD